MKKKLYFMLVMSMSLCFITSCKKGNAIQLSDVSESTVLFCNNGNIKGAFVEDFDKAYYDKDELKEFIKSDIDTFNSKEGNTDAVKLNDTSVSDNIAKVLLTYRDINVYNQYNSSEIQVMTMSEAMEQNILPDTLTDAVSGEAVAKADVAANEKCMVVTTDEVIDVKTEGKIKYYSNAMLLNEKKAQSEADKHAVIVYEK